MKIDVDKIGAVIGPGGKTIRDIIEKTGASIDIDNDGSVQIASVDQAGAIEAKKIIESMIVEPEIGQIYEGPVKKVVDFGVFVEILPGREGLCHVSNLEYRRVGHPSEILKVGDVIKVKLLDIDSQGKLDLSRKALLDKPEGYVEPERKPRRPGNNRNRRPGGNRSGGHGNRH